MMIGLALGLCSTTGKGGVVYEAEAVALFARMTVQPDTTRKGVINTLIKSLKTTGVWSKLAALWVMAAHDNQAGRRNWIADLYNLTAVAGPNFLIDRGYQGDGSTSYLTSGLTSVSQNDNHAGVWPLSDLSNGGIDIGRFTYYIQPRLSDVLNTRNHTSSAASVANTSSSGHFVISRNVSGSYSRYKDAVSFGDAAVASEAPGSQPLAIGARSTGASSADQFSTRRLSIAHVGAGLTAQNVTDMRSAFLIYLQAVGAA